MSSPEGRPQYGEYATPEEQRARIRVPDASASLDAGEAPASVPPTRTTPRPSPTPETATTGPATQRRTADRVVTILLLGLGLYNVLTSIPAYLDFASTAQRSLDAMGLDATFTNVEQGRVWGVVAAVVIATMWLITLLVTVRRMRAGRVAFWIPLLAGILAAIAVAACLSVPLLSDPGVVDALRAGATSTPSPTP